MKKKEPIVVIEEAADIPEEVVRELIERNLDAGQITIMGYGEVPTEVPAIQPRMVRGYSDVVKTYSQKDVYAKDVFVTSAARGQTMTLSTGWSNTLNASITGGIDTASLGITASITVSYSVQHQFTGTSENSQYNCREYRVEFRENRGTYTAKAHDDMPGFIIKVPISGSFTEPCRYLFYSRDMNK